MIYEKSHNNFVHNNICYENQETGLTLRSGDGNIIQNNTMENNGNYGIVLSNYLSLGSHYTTISFNTVNNCPSGGISIYESDNCNIFNNTISNSPANGGIRIILSHRSRVFNNTAFNNQIRVDQASHNQIISNRIEGGTYGIRGYSNSNNNSFFKNEITKVSCGLYLLGGTLANISENLFDDCSIYGIYLTSGNWNSSISRNRIYNSDSGIYSQEGGDYNSYIDNEIYNSSTYGMRIRSSDYLTLSGNSMEKNGLLLEKCVHNSIDSSNTLAGKPIHYYEDQDGLILNGDTSDFAQLYVINSNNTRISNFNFRDLQIGLYVVGGDNVIIENNNISNNDLYGLYVGELNNSIIRGNIANDNEHGIYYSCDDPDDWDEESPDFSLLHHSNTFSQNIANNNKIGFYAYFSLNDVIEENEFSNNSEYGINGKYFYNSSLCGNIVVDNGEYGINLEYTNNTFIEGNQIYSNQIGLKVYESHYAQIIANDIIGNIDYGIFVGNTNFSQTIQNLIMDTNGTGIYFESDSGQNIITDNLFYTNLLHADDNGHDNEWYLENLGNFWDNYTGVDSNNDGIGELPMNITGNAGSSDLYPIFDETIPTIEDATAANITGKLSYMLSWEIGDFYPATYTISLGDEVVVDSTPWSNGTVSYTIPADTLLDGSYFCTIKVVDRFGNNHSSSVLVNVDGTAPTIIHPTNLVMDEETTFILINWTLSDLHPASYSLWLNGTEIVPSTSWTNGNVTYNFTISDLMPGNYTFELRVLDSYGNEVIEEFLIIIADPDDPNVGLIIGIIAGSIVMIGAAIFVIIRKKKA